MIERELTVCTVAGPKLLGWLDDLRDGLRRVLSDTPDEEAIHDLRVALRRIRSLLRLVRPMYGAFYVDRVRADMKIVSDSTSSLRDEEVLDETITKLKLDQTVLKPMNEWLTQRQQHEAQLRSSVVELLRSGTLDAPMAQLAGLAVLPCRPKRDREAKKFARRVVQRAQLKVDQLRVARVDDGVAMHNLRIAYKRLRYAVEAFEPVLPPELRAWGQVATRFQKVLGSLHDHDVALNVIANAPDITETNKRAVIAALRRKRRKLANQYIELVGPAFLNVQPVEDTVPSSQPTVDDSPAEAPAATSAQQVANSASSTSTTRRRSPSSKSPSTKQRSPSSKSPVTKRRTHNRKASSTQPTSTRSNSDETAKNASLQTHRNGTTATRRRKTMSVKNNGSPSSPKKTLKTNT